MKTKLIVISIFILLGLGMDGIAKEHEANKLTLDQFVTKVSNEAEAAGDYELDASEVCDFFKNELTTKQEQECKALESESNND